MLQSPTHRITLRADRNLDLLSDFGDDCPYQQGMPDYITGEKLRCIPVDIPIHEEPCLALDDLELRHRIGAAISRERLRRMTRHSIIIALLLLAGPVQAYVDIPVPQTAAVLEYTLRKPFKKAIVTATSHYDVREDVLVLKILNLKIDSEETSIPASVLSLFKAPRLDTLRLFICPEIMLTPNDYPPKQQHYFAITFRFASRASELESLEDQPTAWIAVKGGKIREIWEIKDIRKSTIPSKQYDLQTLKPVAPKY